MINRRVRLEKLDLFDLLTVDSHGAIVYIVDDEAPKPHKLVRSREEFFNNGLFADVEKNSICILRDNRHVDLDEFLGELDTAKQSCVVLIEGFAGCGKSTLVQYILSEELKTYDFNNSLCNYDIEAQNDLIIRNENGDIIRNSSIFAAIKRCFYEQFIKFAKSHRNVINDFTSLLKKCRSFEPFSDLFYKLFITEPYRQIMEYIQNGVGNKEYIILDLIEKQVETIQSSYCVLGLDYLFRLAIYKNRIHQKLYICYDNLDAIEDAEDLKSFDDKLIVFKEHIDNFIIKIMEEGFFGNLEMPHFVIIATYRKITANMAFGNAALYREVRIDDKSSYRGPDFIYNIDATSVFSYKRIVEQRLKYFKNYFEKAFIKDEIKKKILADFESWNSLNQRLEIMQDRYSCLWNKNYRTCSVIANELYSRSIYHFQTNVEFINNGSVLDGYNISEDIEGNNVLCSYYGGSAIMLSSVCQVFNTFHIWDDFLDLAKLNSGEKSYKHVSLSRMILTYMYNKNDPVSFENLVYVFCNKGLFKSDKLCTILSKMLARNPKGVWRRPIYYADECILSEEASDIAKKLQEEYQMILKSGTSLHNYKFLLCDSGKSYVERLMQEFEFFSNRISNNNRALYLYSNRDDIKRVMEDVFNAVKQCCENMKDFREKYIKAYNLSAEQYLEMEFHPRTNMTHSPQMHTERTIFSHIAYLNNVRRYFINKNVTNNLYERKEYNKLFVTYIQKYLDLYYAYIGIYSAKRRTVADRLKKKADPITEEIKNDGNNNKILFMSISISNT